MRMHWKRHFIEGATLIVAAVVCAMVANAVASRERKLTVIPTFAAPPPSARAAAAAPPPTATESPVTAPTTTNVAPVTTTTTTTTATTTAATPKTSTVTTAAPKPAAKPAKSLADFKPHPDKAYVEIGYDDVAALHAAGALFLDARRTSIYEQGHIAGARPFSVWESDIDDKVNKLFSERSDPASQNQPIVAYCSGGDCEDSHMLAQKLWGIQFNNVYVYKDGFPDWQKRGGDIHTGANP